MRSWISSTKPSLWVARSLPRCWPACWLTVPLAWSRPHHVPVHVPTTAACASADLAWGTGVWQPGRTGCGPLTGHSLTTWWPVWSQLRSSQLRLQLFRWLLVLVALLSLSRLRLDLESVSIIGLTGVGPEGVRSPAPGRETKVPRAA
jgi:hypothetical protein